MAIAAAVQNGNIVRIYDAEGRQLASLYAGSSAGDGLQGYTANSVSIREGVTIKVYDENGRQVSSIYAG